MKLILFANTDWYLYNFRQAQARFLRARGAEVALVSPPGEYGPRLQEAGYRWLPVDMKRSSMNPLTELALIAQLVRLYRAEQPQLVHHFTIKSVLYGSLAAKWTGVPSIINGVTGLGYVFGEGGFFRRLLRWLVERWYRMSLAGTQAIFDNEEDRQFFIRRRMVAGDASHVVRSAGVDLDLLVSRPEPAGEPVVVYAGRMLWDKGIGELVEAARLLQREKVAIRIALVGRPDPANPASITEEQLRAWDAEKAVEYWGWRSDMVNVYNEAHIFCLPSYREGLPTTIIEAAACSRPVVATDVPGCRDAVRHGETGLLVPLKDPAALAAALRQLAQDPALRLRMGAAGREMAAVEFSTTRVNEETLTVYARSGLKGL
ncbi:MAG: glycosyltransferase family 4 protein [Chloroflexi bacterium]|nr:glycosyltransferase family 4 protein [Chloroflexota bacterium]